MDTRKFIALLARPQDVTSDDVQALNQIVDTYPYFQSARALQLKGLKNAHSFQYNDALKVTAAYTTDRDVLFDYITSEEFVQNQISEIIQQNLEAIMALPVVSENITEQVSLEIDRQMKAEMKKAEAILDPQLFERKTSSVSKMVASESDDTVETPSEPSLEVDAPLSFSKEETHTFSEWLKLTKAVPIERKPEEVKKTKEPSKKKNRKFELIDKFIQEQPKIKPKEPQSTQIDLSEPYTQPSERLMTETLAKVYLKQKNYKKAIQAYKILILKNPEKSGFFADQIRAIENIIKEQQ